jgi:hypothetical protein
VIPSGGGRVSASMAGVVQIIDEVCGARRGDAGASTGTYLALAALNRVVAPCSKPGFKDWWARTAAPRFTKIPAAVLDHRRFWDAMHVVTLEDLDRSAGGSRCGSWARLGRTVHQSPST